MFPNGITTVGKTFRMVCTVEGEEFVGWFDVNGNKVTARPIPGQLTRDKFYVIKRGNSYSLVIQKVTVADGGNYTCKGDQTEGTFTLFVESKYHYTPILLFTLESFYFNSVGATQEIHTVLNYSTCILFFFAFQLLFQKHMVLSLTSHDVAYSVQSSSAFLYLALGYSHVLKYCRNIEGGSVAQWLGRLP